MNKILLSTCLFFMLTSCSPVITKEAAQVAFHTQFSQLLNGCERLGPIKLEYETKMGLSRSGNETQAKIDMRQMAYDKYKADNLVFINLEYVDRDQADGKKDIIYAQGAAFKCDK